MNINWTNNSEYLIGSTKKFKFLNKLAGFDLDGTIIKPKSGAKFPKDHTDWTFLYDNTISKIKKLTKEGFCILIITNQSLLSKKGESNENEFKLKINNIVKELNVEVKILCSTGKNKYRKPSPIFYYDFIPEKIRQSLSNDSFYCGDAAGRIHDFAATDFKFALNCMLNFYTPEQLFLNETQILPKIEYPNIHKIKQLNFTFTPKDKEMIIMIGFQASGKSYISNLISEKYNYVIINNDTLKTNKKRIDLLNISFENNKSIIIDNTNPDKKTRKEYIDLAKKNNYSLRCIYMTTSMDISKHNNYYRMIKGGLLIPDIAYNIFNKKLEEPLLNEGFTEIIKLNAGYPKDPLYFDYLY